MRVRVSNQSSDTLYLQHCGPAIAARLEQETDRGWVQLPSEECARVLYAPIAIAPAETRLVETPLEASVVSPGGRLQGHFRIVLQIARSTDDSPNSRALLPLAERTSQVFTIE